MKPDPTGDALVEMRSCRARVIRAEAVLAVVGDDVATATAWDVSPGDPQRDLISARVRIALDRVCGDLESSQPAILRAADEIERLRALLDKLEAR